jgi:cell division topological specificity factor
LFDFFNKLFKPVQPSGATAKERLRLVLLSDHLALAPDVIEALKRDLLVVISRYVEIDGANADVTFEHREGEVAMLASIPITGVRPRTRAESPTESNGVPRFEPQTAVLESRALDEPQQPELLAPPPDAAPVQPPITASPAVAAAPGTAPRRRRRRKSAAAKHAPPPAKQFNASAQA